MVLVMNVLNSKNSNHRLSTHDRVSSTDVLCDPFTQSEADKCNPSLLGLSVLISTQPSVATSGVEMHLV